MKSCISIAHCSEEKKILFNIKGYDILECKTCGHRFYKLDNQDIHLDDVYSNSYFFEGGDGYPNYLEEKEILINHGTYYANLISKYLPAQGSVLDVGCAAGFILKGFEKRGWVVKGIEPNQTMVAYGKKELGLDLNHGNLESYQDENNFDLISMIQVIGHFKDLDKALKNVCTLLKPFGFVLVESWNRDSLLSRLLGKHWHEYSPPSVIHWFSDKTLINLFEFYGFKLVDKGRPLKRINLKHAISLIVRKFPNFFLKQKIINFFNEKAGKLNVIYPPLDIKWYLFQKNN